MSKSDGNIATRSNEELRQELADKIGFLLAREWLRRTEQADRFVSLTNPAGLQNIRKRSRRGYNASDEAGTKKINGKGSGIKSTRID